MESSGRALPKVVSRPPEGKEIPLEPLLEEEEMCVYSDVCGTMAPVKFRPLRRSVSGLLRRADNGLLRESETADIAWITNKTTGSQVSAGSLIRVSPIRDMFSPGSTGSHFLVMDSVTDVCVDGAEGGAVTLQGKVLLPLALGDVVTVGSRRTGPVLCVSCRDSKGKPKIDPL